MGRCAYREGVKGYLKLVVKGIRVYGVRQFRVPNSFSVFPYTLYLIPFFYIYIYIPNV